MLLYQTLEENKKMKILETAVYSSTQNFFERDDALSVEHFWAILSQKQMTLKGKTGQ